MFVIRGSILLISDQLPGLTTNDIRMQFLGGASSFWYGGFPLKRAEYVQILTGMV